MAPLQLALAGASALVAFRDHRYDWHREVKGRLFAGGELDVGPMWS